mgnify:FL=1
MTEERNYEDEARKQGWKPEGEYSGKAAWTDAKTFVQKGEQIAGILKSRLDKQDAQIQQLQSANKEFGEYTNELIKKERGKTQQAIQQLEEARAKAIDMGDGQEFTRLDSELNAARTQLERPASNGAESLDPLASEWLGQNDWYNSNRKLKYFADGLAEDLVAEGFRGQAYYSELTRRTIEQFPEEFGNPNQSRANSVESGGTPVSEDSETEHAYKNLPADAKAACDRYVKSGLTTVEDYVSNYEWDE